MKNITRLLILIFVLLFGVLFISCNNEDDKGNENNSPLPPISSFEVLLDKTEYTNTEELLITGKVTFLDSNLEQKEVIITSSMVKITDTENENEKKVTVTYEDNGISIFRDVIIHITKEEVYETGIKEVKLDVNTFNDLDSISLTGSIIIKLSNNATKTINLEPSYITMPDSIVQGENKIIITYNSFSIYASFYYIEKSNPIDNPEDLLDKVEEHIRELYDGKTFDTKIDLIFEYLGVDIDYESKNTSIIGHAGKLTQPILDTEVKIIYYIFSGSYEREGIMTVIAKGYGNYVDATFNEIKGYVPSKVTESFDLPTFYEKYEATLTWKIGDDELPNGHVEVKKEDEDYYITIYCTCSAKGDTGVQKYSVLCSMLTDVQKMNKALNRISSQYALYKVDKSLELPNYDDDYGCKLIWYSYNPDIIDHDGTYHKPFYDIDINFKVQAKIGQQIETKIITVSVIGMHYDSKWEQIEYFINRIHKDEIKTQKFNLYGCEEGYYTVPTKNIGYLPFYTKNEIEIVTHYLPTGSGLKPDRLRTSTYYITLHNTGMAHPTATAKGLDDYIHSTNRVASWHYAIDDHGAYNHVPIDEVAWHAGDGSHYYGDIWYSESYRFYGIGGGNNNSVGIEMCVYSGCDFNWVMRNTAKQVSWLLVKYKLNPSRIRQHYDYSGKDCPQVLRSSGRWPEMLELINIEYFARTQLSDVEFVWKSLNPDIMDDTGTVINNPGVDTQIEYEVTVTYNGESRTYKFSSLLKKI